MEIEGDFLLFDLADSYRYFAPPPIVAEAILELAGSATQKNGMKNCTRKSKLKVRLFWQSNVNQILETKH